MRSVVIIQLPTLTAKEGRSLNTMVSGNYKGLASIDDFGTTRTELMNAAMLFFFVLYS